jgi:hypothetical protein
MLMAHVENPAGRRSRGKPSVRPELGIKLLSVQVSKGEELLGEQRIYPWQIRRKGSRGNVRWLRRGPKEVERKRETGIPKEPSGEPSATTRTTEKQTPDNPAFAPDDVSKTTQPIPPASAMRSAADFQAWLKSLPPPPKSFSIGQDLNWDAPWIEVTLRVELPFWLMVGNTEIPIEVGDHTFPVSIHGESFELHICAISDAKLSRVHQGPLRKREELNAEIQDFLRTKPDANPLWRKCKTVLKITSRCNEDVWNKRPQIDEAIRRSAHLYMEELCRAHIPVVNRLIQAYRLATYDHFAFEVAPWDVPYWLVERDGDACSCILVPYRGWDHRPIGHDGPDGGPQRYQLIQATSLREKISDIGTRGEMELLDAINFMERGNYSDAIRRITTAIEVVVAAVAGYLVEQHEGVQAAAKLLEKTRLNFPGRIAKYEALSGRKLPDALKKDLNKTRTLRNHIVHGGHRIR